MLGKFIRDLATYAPSKFVPALTALIITPILTRLFLPVDYGYWALAAGVSDLLFALACSGIGSGAVRFYAAYKLKGELGVFFATLISTTGFAIAFTSAASILIIALLQGYLPAELYPLLLISVLIFAVQSLFTVFMEVVRAQEKSGLYTRFNLLNTYGGLGIGLFLVLFYGFRIEGLLWGTLIALLLIVPILFVTTTKGNAIGRSHFRRQNILEVWTYAWPLAIGNVAMWGLRISDRYIIGLFRPGTEVGLYSAAYNISGKSIDILVSLFILSMGPLVVNSWEQKGRAETERVMTMITRLFLIFCLPVTVGLTLLALPVIDLLTSPAYHEGFRVVGYVAFATFAWGIAQIACRGLLIGKNTRTLALNQMAAAIVNVGLNFLLVPMFGFVAAGFTTLVGYVLLVILQAYASRSYLAWRFPTRTMVNALIAVTLMGLVVVGIYPSVDQDKSTGFIQLLLSVLAAIPVYFGALWLLGEADANERTAIRQFWYKLAGRFA